MKTKTKKPVVPLLRWNELTEEAQQRLDTSGHPSNRPTDRDKQSPRPIFKADGSGWLDFGCLAGVFGGAS